MSGYSYQPPRNDWSIGGAAGGGGGGSGGGGGGGGRGVCFDFQKGRCSRGDSCSFEHVLEAGRGGGGGGGGGYGSGGGGRGVCFDFQKGRCTRGDSCNFSHEQEGGGGGGGGGYSGGSLNQIPVGGGGGGYGGGGGDRERDDDRGRGGGERGRSPQREGGGGGGGWGEPGSEMEDTVFIMGMPKTATEQDVLERFGSVGIIKEDKKKTKDRHNPVPGAKKVFLYRDKRTREPKGEATVSYDDPGSALAAIEFFNGKEAYHEPPWQGHILQVSIAQRKKGHRPDPRHAAGGRGGYGGRGGGYGGGGGGGGGYRAPIQQGEYSGARF